MVCPECFLERALARVAKLSGMLLGMWPRDDNGAGDDAGLRLRQNNHVETSGQV